MAVSVAKKHTFRNFDLEKVELEVKSGRVQNPLVKMMYNTLLVQGDYFFPR